MWHVEDMMAISITFICLHCLRWWLHGWSKCFGSAQFQSVCSHHHSFTLHSFCWTGTHATQQWLTGYELDMVHAIPQNKNIYFIFVIKKDDHFHFYHCHVMKKNQNPRSKEKQMLRTKHIIGLLFPHPRKNAHTWIECSHRLFSSVHI